MVKCIGLGLTCDESGFYVVGDLDLRTQAVGWDGDQQIIMDKSVSMPRGHGGHVSQSCAHACITNFPH
jgi:hypothetical protein